jgi:hypothetical protein
MARPIATPAPSAYVPPPFITEAIELVRRCTEIGDRYFAKAKHMQSLKNYSILLQNTGVRPDSLYFDWEAFFTKHRVAIMTSDHQCSWLKEEDAVCIPVAKDIPPGIDIGAFVLCCPLGTEPKDTKDKDRLLHSFFSVLAIVLRDRQQSPAVLDNILKPLRVRLGIAEPVQATPAGAFDANSLMSVATNWLNSFQQQMTTAGQPGVPGQPVPPGQLPPGAPTPMGSGGASAFAPMFEAFQSGIKFLGQPDVTNRLTQSMEKLRTAPNIQEGFQQALNTLDAQELVNRFRQGMPPPQDQPGSIGAVPAPPQGQPMAALPSGPGQNGRPPGYAFDAPPAGYAPPVWPQPGYGTPQHAPPDEGQPQQPTHGNFQNSAYGNQPTYAGPTWPQGSLAPPTPPWAQPPAQSQTHRPTSWNPPPTTAASSATPPPPATNLPADTPK